MVTTTRADRPASSFLGNLSPGWGLDNAKPGRATCSRKPFSNAGMPPSHSGKKNTRWLAHRMSCCTGASASGTLPPSQSALLRSSGKSSRPTSTVRTS